MKLQVRGEMQTTPERCWALYFDPQFNLELRQLLQVESIEEKLFEDTPDHIKMIYHVAVRRNLPDWVRKAIPDVKVAYTSFDTFDKKRNIMEMHIKTDFLSNKISGSGVWTVKTTRPGWVERRYDGEIKISLPLVGGTMEEKLCAALEHDFGLSNELMVRWVKRDLDALAAGKPLPELGKPTALKALGATV